MNCTLMHLKSKTRKNFGFRSVYVAVLDVLPSTSGAPGAARTRNLLIRRTVLGSPCRICGGIEYVR